MNFFEKSLNEKALRDAVINDSFQDLIKLLFQQKALLKDDAIKINSNTLAFAAQYNRFDMVKLLIPISNPGFNESAALRWAAAKGFLAIVNLLLPVSQPKDNYSWALASAAENGHTDIVKVLIPVSDPSAQSSWALKGALKKGHADAARLLIPVSRVDSVINTLIGEGSPEGLDLLLHLCPKILSKVLAKVNDRQDCIERMPFLRARLMKDALDLEKEIQSSPRIFPSRSRL